MSAQALIAGASGLTGGYLLKILLDSGQYDHVTSIGRTKLSVDHAKLMQRVVDYYHLPHDLFNQSVSACFCCLGTTIKKAGSQAMFRMVDREYVSYLARACEQAGVPRFLLISSIGANPESRVFYSRVKGETEQVISRCKIDSISIFRPSLLLDDRTEYRAGERVSTAVMTALAPLMVGGLKRYRPIHARVVASAMFAVSLQVSAGVHVYESEQIAEIGSQASG